MAGDTAFVAEHANLSPDVLKQHGVRLYAQRMGLRNPDLYVRAQFPRVLGRVLTRAVGAEEASASFSSMQSGTRPCNCRTCGEAVPAQRRCPRHQRSSVICLAAHSCARSAARTADHIQNVGRACRSVLCALAPLAPIHRLVAAATTLPAQHTALQDLARGPTALAAWTRTAG
jgi:hypothetical protein